MSLTTSPTVPVLEPSVAATVGDVAADMASLSIAGIPALLSLLRAGTPAEMADILGALDAGMALWHERQGSDAVAAPSKSARGSAGAASASAAPKKAGRPKKAPAAAALPLPLPLPLPEVGEDGAPDVAAYRMAPESIDESTCVGRKLDGGEDKRWKPAVYRESQCGKALKDGCDLCTTCAGREEKFAETSKAGAWNGRVTEEPPAWCHMLGTTWGDEKSPKWLGAASASGAASAASASDSGSVSDASEQMSAVAAATTKVDKSAAAAAKKAEKEAAAAAKKAEKEASAAAKAAEKEAAAAAKKAEKEAAAAAKKAEKAAAKPAKPAKPAKEAKPKAEKAKKSAAAAAEPAKAAAAEPVAVEGNVKLIDGTLYMIKSGNVYEYDELTEQAGDFVGRLTEDGEAIDPDAEEEGAAEEDDE